jgi:hypothetical protein
VAAFHKPGREIAALAGLQIIFFLALALLEPRFLFVHFYELIPYVAILVLFAYGRTRWVYLIGPLVSLMWLILAYSVGLLHSAIEQVRQFHGAPANAVVVALLALATAAVAVLMIVLCRIHWLKEFSGRGRALAPLLGSIAIVAVYYASLLHWFWDLMRED